MKTGGAWCAVFLVVALLQGCHQHETGEVLRNEVAEQGRGVNALSPASTGSQAPAMIVGVVTPGAAPGPGSVLLRRYVARPGSKVRIEGTSNIHDWQVEGPLIGGFLEAAPGFPADPNSARSARVDAFISVRSLKSVEKGGAPYSDRMDDVLYEAMKSQPHSRIFYTLSSLTPRGSASGGHFSFDSVGMLAVAGVTNAIEMPVTVTVLPENRLKIRGTVAVKMTSFGIQPPSPKLLGPLINTGDEVKLLFEWALAENPASLASAR